MSIGSKIRILLFILGICCVVTALSLNNAITKRDLLEHEAEQLQTNLNAKERRIYSLLADAKQVKQLGEFVNNSELALNFIQTYRPDGINLLIYKNNEILFWTTARVFPKNVDRIKEGSTFAQMPNGYFELIKKTEKDYVYLFVITVKTQYAIQNQYLVNQIAPELFPAKSLQVASFTDRETKEIFSVNKEYLFPVKLTADYNENIYTVVRIWLWIIGLLCIASCINSFCSLLAKQGHLVLATLMLVLCFLLFRLTDLKFLWLNHQFDVDLFKPAIYAESDLLPSLGDLLLNVLSITWVLLFIYIHRFEYKFHDRLTRSRFASILIQATYLILMGCIAFLVEDIFSGLIFNSKINFDISDIIELDWLSWTCIFILCLVWFNIYLLANVFLEISKKLNITHKQRIILFLTLVSGVFVYKLFTEFTIYFLLYAILVFVFSYNNYIQAKKTSISTFAVLFLCMALLTSLKYIKFTDIKERTVRETIAQKLLYEDDPKVIGAIESFEKGLQEDSLIIRYFKQPLLTQTFNFQNYIIKKYLDGYLSRFEYKMYEYNSADSSLKFGESIVPLSKYRGLVQDGSIKTQESFYFYRINDTFGFQNYFGIIPIFEGQKKLGTLVVELKSQPLDYNNRFPELLIDGKLNSDQDFSNYSFAFYKDNVLYGQSGVYTYPLYNSGRFTAGTEAIDFTDDVKGVQPDASKLFSHAVFQPEPSKVIVISKEKMSFVARLAATSFFFLVFILFGLLLNALLWLMKNADTNRGGWFGINRYLMINANKILYKTRIQLSIVLAVVATLLIVGWTTFFNIKEDYRRQQEDFIRGKIRKVQAAYEKMILNRGIIRNDDESKFEFNQFADINDAYLNLYDINGTVYLTSLPKMFDYGILGRKMGPMAYINLHQKQRSEFLNPIEKVGTFVYASAYVPIRNAQNQTIAYLGMPYYSNESDYQDKIGVFINTLINIYALVFVLVGILAVFLANQITNPLNFIQESIRKTKLGESNEPIYWHRQDEIGALIKEYNKMISALEDSAIKLARSERESAWREMAKQVAHEIKNPLTPLKLGVQLLEKSWKEKDPNFENKFAKFSKSFLEQIESLSTIASEFSNFAKMPDTKLAKIELTPILLKAIEVFNNIDNVEIFVVNRTTQPLWVMGDKEQLLRVFNNLLKNAIEASEDNERCAIKVSIANDSVLAFVDIEDSGKGIEKVLQDKIFIPNFTTKSSGTGLGLAFVKQAIENAGGTVGFNSEENVGTTFFLTFPLLNE